MVGVSSIAFLGSYGIDVEKFNKIDGMVGVMQTYYAGEIAAQRGEWEHKGITGRNSSRNHVKAAGRSTVTQKTNGKDLVEFSDSKHGQNGIGRQSYKYCSIPSYLTHSIPCHEY